MRKIKLLSILFICLFCFCLNVKAEACDVDGDGSITNKDLNQLQKMINENNFPIKNTAKFDNADCNMDGKIDTLDIAALKMKIEESSEDINGSKTKKVYCGSEENGRVTGIPAKIPELTSTAVTIIQVVVPVILVILGSIDLFKGITAGKEDEMKKGQQMFVKRLVVAAIIFLVVIIVKFLISVVADTNATNIADCIDCFISNDCEEM